jgi:hypothetical protein
MLRRSVREITKTGVQVFPSLQIVERVAVATLDFSEPVRQFYTPLGLLIGR